MKSIIGTDVVWWGEVQSPANIWVRIGLEQYYLWHRICGCTSSSLCVEQREKLSLDIVNPDELSSIRRKSVLINFNRKRHAAKSGWQRQVELKVKHDPAATIAQQNVRSEHQLAK